jgi:hypothetical protein
LDIALAAGIARKRATRRRKEHLMGKKLTAAYCRTATTDESAM